MSMVFPSRASALTGSGDSLQQQKKHVLRQTANLTSTAEEAISASGD